MTRVIAMQKVEGSNPFSRFPVAEPFPAILASRSPDENGSMRNLRATLIYAGV
jgi:hypothetical protein